MSQPPKWAWKQVEKRNEKWANCVFIDRKSWLSIGCDHLGIDGCLALPRDTVKECNEVPLGEFFPRLSQGLLQLYKSRGSNVTQRKWPSEACSRHTPWDSSQATWLAYPFAWWIPAPGSGSQRRHDGEGRCRPWACSSQSSHPMAKQLVGVTVSHTSHHSLDDQEIHLSVRLIPP